MGWWEGENFLDCAAVFLNIGQGGASVRAEALPPGQHVWVRLEEPAATGWCAAIMIRVEESSGERPILGLSFNDPCEYELFKGLAYGTGAQGRPSCSSPEFEDRYWR